MLEALSKVAQRRMYICNLVISKSREFDTEEIAKKFNTTERVIVNDFKFLSNHIENLDIQILPDSIVIDSSKQFSLSALYRYYFNTEDIFILLDYIFYHPQCAIKDITHDCFISRSKLYRLINKTNNVLRRFGIKISSTSNVSISGEEIAIRRFYAQLFSEKYTIQQNEFQIAHHSTLDELIIRVMQALTIPQNFANFFRLQRSIYTSFIRMQQGYDIPTSSLNGQKLMDLLQGQEGYITFARKFQKEFSLEIDCYLIEQLFYNYIQDEICFNEQEFLSLIQDNPYFSNSMQAINRMLDHFIAAYPYVALKDRFQLAMLIHNTTVKMEHDVNVTYLLYDYSMSFNEVIKDHYPTIYKHYYQMLADYIELMGRDNSRPYVKYLMNTIASAWPTLYEYIQRHYVAPVKLQVISTTSVEFAQLICDVLESRYSNLVKAIPYTGIDISSQHLDDLDAELLVFTFDIQDPPKTIPFLCVERLPSERDQRRLKRMLDDILSRRDN